MTPPARDDAPPLRISGAGGGYGGRDILKGVDLTVTRGEIVGLVGPNGAGKSTLLKLVMGAGARSGEILVAGSEAGTAAARARLGVAPQMASLFDSLTARENLFCFGRIAGVAPSSLPARVDSALVDLNIVPFADEISARLSGGQRQRVSIAAALVHAPALLLLDEPAASLDAESVAALNSTLAGLAARGLGVLIVTHDMAQAAALCHRVAVVVGGRIAADASPQALIARHAPAGVELVIERAASTPFDGFEPTAPGKWRRRVPTLTDAATLAARYGEDAAAIEIRHPGLADVVAALQSEAAP